MKQKSHQILVCLPFAVLMFAGDATAQGNKTCDSSCTNGPSCTFRGLQNSPLGNANISVDDDCNLRVDGIGGSGQDGVIQTGLRSAYMKTTLGTPNFSLSATGTTANIRQLGVVDDQPDREIMLTTIVNFNGDDLRHTISCSEILVEGYRIYIYNDNLLVNSQDHGANPPFLIYPKTDILWMACGIWPNGDVYTVFKLGSPQAITLQTAIDDPGPFVGDLVFVEADSPQSIPREQNSIENTFFATGPMTLQSVEAGSLPGYGSPCSSGENSMHLARFARRGWQAISACAERGTPACPAPCVDFPTLDESRLSPSCYDQASNYLDEIATSTLSKSWGANRCPVAPADSCDRLRSQVVQRLLWKNRNGPMRRELNDLTFCHGWFDALGGAACDDHFCSEATERIHALFSATR